MPESTEFISLEEGRLWTGKGGMNFSDRTNPKEMEGGIHNARSGANQWASMWN